MRSCSWVTPRSVGKQRRLYRRPEEAGEVDSDFKSSRLFTLRRFDQNGNELSILRLEGPLRRRAAGGLGQGVAAGGVDHLGHAPGELLMIVRIAQDIAVLVRA